MCTVTPPTNFIMCSLYIHVLRFVTNTDFHILLNVVYEYNMTKSIHLGSISPRVHICKYVIVSTCISIVSICTLYISVVHIYHCRSITINIQSIATILEVIYIGSSSLSVCIGSVSACIFVIYIITYRIHMCMTMTHICIPIVII